MYCILIYLAGLYVSTLALDKQYYDLRDFHYHFSEFMATYNKHYPNATEFHKRFNIFVDNLQEINDLNAISEAIYGITEFSDWTEDEYANIINAGVLDTDDTIQLACKIITDRDFTTNDAPDSLDYREKNLVTPVKNQGACQSCWAFASIGSIEAQYAAKYKVLETFSEQQLMDCLKSSGHCARGSYMVNALTELIQTPGVMRAQDYPYVGRDLRCQLDQTKARVRITGCYNFRLQNENKLKEALYKYGPIAIAVNAKTFRNYRGGIFTLRDCPIDVVGHAVLLVGYGTERGRKYWLIKNSSGPKFGLDGYIKISRGQNTCNLMNQHAASAIIA